VHPPRSLGQRQAVLLSQNLQQRLQGGVAARLLHRNVVQIPAVVVDLAACAERLEHEGLSHLVRGDLSHAGG